MEVLPVFSIITLGSSDVKYKTVDTITVPAVPRISNYTHFYGLIIPSLALQHKMYSKTFFDISSIKYVASQKNKRLEGYSLQPLNYIVSSLLNG